MRLVSVQEMRVVLTVKDLDGAIAMLRDALRLHQLAEFHNGGGRGVLLEAGRATLELFDEAQAAAIDDIEVGRRTAGTVRIGFKVAESPAAGAALAAAGAGLVAGPVETPWGDRNVRLAGPESIELTLFTSPA